jgi:pyridoxine kinase
LTRQHRALAIHDISCFGRCSLTVALPILSAAGVETAVLPTAVLSTHTGGFSGYTYRDLTEDVNPIAEHWTSLGLEFDAIYTGYLGSFEQIEIVSSLFDRFGGENTLIVVDPVMADNGVLYAGFPSDFPDGMRKLCAKADVIVPNLTEAAFLLGREYHESPHTQQEIEELLRALADLGPRKVVLTGVSHDARSLGAASYDANADKVEYAFSTRIPMMYHGTGDVFASALTAALIEGVNLSGATRVAVDFTVAALSRTRESGTDNRFGVDFEHGLAGFSALVDSAIQTPVK